MLPSTAFAAPQRAGEKIGSDRGFGDGRAGLFALRQTGDVRTPRCSRTSTCCVYDIQDVGARVYTYQWTMANTADVAKKPIIVLDRPDPIRADRYEGNILDPKFASLVGQYPVALRYGLTPGELLRFLAGTKLIDANVTSCR